jgi:plasmid stability protein
MSCSESIRKVDETTIELLKIRAATNGVSMEEEIRRILDEAVATPNKLGSLAVRTFGEEFGVDLEETERTPYEPLEFGK